MTNQTNTNAKSPFLGNSLYNFLKWTTAVGLPGVNTLYFTLSGLWGWPDAEKVIGTIAAVNVFLGLVLAAGTVSYNKSDSKYIGALNVSTDEDGTASHSLEFNAPLDVLSQQKDLTLKVQNVASGTPPTTGSMDPRLLNKSSDTDTSEGSGASQ